MIRVLRWMTGVLLVVLAVLAYRSIPEARRDAWWQAARHTGETRVGGGESGEEAGQGTDGQISNAAGAEDRPGSGDEDGEASPSRVHKVEGLNAIRMSPLERQQTGIVLLELVKTTQLSESLAVGRVLDIQPLVDLRTSFNAARGDQDIARLAASASSRAAQRLRVLNREDGNVSTRQLQEAESLAAADNARAAAATRRLQDLRNQALTQWGQTLVDMVLAEDSKAFDQLVAHHDALVLVTLRPGDELSDQTSLIYIGPTGERGRARKAYLVSPAPRIDIGTQGETYYFRCNASNLRVGMRMDAWIPRPGEAQEGVEVPGTAVIWYASKLWVYVRQDKDLFVRRPLIQYEETRDGWFVSNGVAPGDEIVVSGAQMLFSEEFRSAIPSEDEARE